MGNLMNHTINQNSSPFLRDESGKVVAFNPNACNLCNESTEHHNKGFNLGLVQILDGLTGNIETITRGSLSEPIPLAMKASILVTLNLEFNSTPLGNPLDVCQKCTFYDPNNELSCKGAKTCGTNHDAAVIFVQIEP